MEPVTNLQDIQVAAQQRPRRTVHRYKIPPKDVPFCKGVKSIAIVELTGDEIIQADKRAHSEKIRGSFELYKACLYEMDGQRVSLADHTADEAWEAASARLRSYIARAFDQVHTPKEEDLEDFLATQQID